MTTTLIARLEDTLIAVRSTGPNGQHILLQATPQGRRLAQLLSAGEELARQEGFFIVPHGADVDDRLRILVDVLTAVRWLHPTYTQLSLDLRTEGERETTDST